jgi:hypothetical protein
MLVAGGNNSNSLKLTHEANYPDIRVVHIHVIKEKRTSYNLPKIRVPLKIQSISYEY